MSKDSFSRELLEKAYDNIKAIHKENIWNLDLDDNFKTALGITYLVLSKDKFIKKDKDNNHRIDRLSKNVATSDINALFLGCNEPEILHTLEDDNVWILDNFRDSLAHEKSDIDEDQRKILIFNDIDDRHLNAIIKFDWLDEYMRADILSKRKTNHFVKKGIYYNNYIDKNKSHETLKIINDSIIYKVEVDGQDLNMRKLSDMIEHVFNNCSKEEFENGKYNESFARAKIKLEEEILKEYPDAKIRISRDKQKLQIRKKAKKKLSNYYSDYDEVYENIKTLFERKSTIILNTLRDIFDFIDNNIDEENIFRKLNSDIGIMQRKELVNRLLCTFIYIYGINSIVINKNKLLNDEYLSLVDNAIFKVGNQGIRSCSIIRRNSLEGYLDKIDGEKHFLYHYQRCHKENVKKLYLNAKEEKEKAMKEYYNNFYVPLIPKGKIKEKPLHIRDYLICVIKDTISKYEEIDYESNTLKKEYKNIVTFRG